MESNTLRDGYLNNSIENFVWLNNNNLVITYYLGRGILLDMMNINDMKENKEIMNILCKYNNENIDLSNLILDFCGIIVTVTPFNNKYGCNVHGAVPSEVTGFSQNDCGVFIAYYSHDCILFIPHIAD